MKEVDQKNRSRISIHSKNPSKNIRIKRVKKIFSILMSSLLLSIVLIAVFLVYLHTQALPVANISQTSHLYDMQDNVIDSYYYGQNRQIVPLQEISPYLVQATLAIEDHRFYQNIGFDFKGMARAAWTDIKTLSLKQGASTITQQLAKNLYLNQKKTWGRKIKEALYTIELEMKMSKQQILETYLNQIYYGFSTYGIDAAAEMYFGKHAKDLTLAESTMLAGIPKGPKFYSPLINKKNAKARQEVVLQAMVRYGNITSTQAEQAYQEKLIFTPLKKKTKTAPYFRDYIRNIAAKKLGITDTEFEQGGYNVYTTLDLRAQKNAESAIHHYIPADNQLEAALVAIDPRTGYVKAMVGGKDYSENQFNRVFTTTRQTGSSFKPILYLTALQNQFTPITQYKSEPTVFTYDQGRKKYAPSDYADEYTNTFIDMRTAIARSDNIYAVHTVMDVGPQKVIDMARKMGITSPMEPVPSLALGVFPVSPFEMAAAFGIIANQGVRVQPTSILRIEDSFGHVLYQANPKKTTVVNPAYTYVLTSLMESVFAQGGTGSRVSYMLKRPVAAKTGTTDTDAWMVGFTPELSTAVWVGYDKNRKISPAESHLASPIFASFTSEVLKPVPPKIFPIPSNVVSEYIDPKNGKLATKDTPAPRLENFVRGTEPTEYSTLSTGKQTKKNLPLPFPDKHSSWWKDLKKWWNE